jgi:hypothetical protein
MHFCRISESGMTDLPNLDRLAVRWTIGDVCPRGFEMLRLSIACAHRLFGDEAQYVVCVNSMPWTLACERTGTLPHPVEWREVTHADVSPILLRYVDANLLEGMGWKLVPLRTHCGLYELALDNDCILWDIPKALSQWLGCKNATLFAEDVERCLGSFDRLCPEGCFNAGIRGLAPDTDVAIALETLMQRGSNAWCDAHLSSEIEEQGLQAALIFSLPPVLLVSTDEVSICSPFWPRSSELGTCGAHFVGMNAWHIPWNYYDRPADVWLQEHWLRHRPALYSLAGLPLPSDVPYGNLVYLSNATASATSATSSAAPEKA